jgi:hypothetical protein
MALDRIAGTKPAEFSDTTKHAGQRLDSGPYIGIVKNNVDPLRKGRLEVWIPEMGGDEDLSQNWITVGYASPFYGSTYSRRSNTAESTATEFDTVYHTYGMWFVPPDLDNQVLVMFVAGDPSRGYWIACISPHRSHAMVPGMASTPNLTDQSRQPVSRQIKANTAYPAVEANENELARNTLSPLPTLLPRPLHRVQFQQLVQQGLQDDNVRGTTTSSSQRESPSYVFGISTPGRPIPDPKDNPSLLEQYNKKTIPPEVLQVTARQGGHIFVMDDGATNGSDRQIKLRTAQGHQLIMHDTDGSIYVSNSQGSVWMELTNSGHVNVYSSTGVNIRSGGNINMHSDADININAVKNINIRAGETYKQQATQTDMISSNQTVIYSARVQLKSDGDMNFQSGGVGSWGAGGNMILNGSRISLNSGSAPSVTKPVDPTVYQVSDTRRDGDAQVWLTRAGALASIANIVPSHEPWPRERGQAVGGAPPPAPAPAPAPAPGAPPAPAPSNPNAINCTPAPAPEFDRLECQAARVQTGSGGTLTDSSGQPVGTGSSQPAGSGRALKKPMDKSRMNRADCYVPPSGVGPLSVLETKALMAQIGWVESSWNYQAVNQIGYSGKYQFGAQALVDRGLIKLEEFRRFGNRAFDRPEAWTPRAVQQGINSREAWLRATALQEQVMLDQLKANYRTLRGNGGITDSDDVCTVAGMLTVAHLLGAGGANSWKCTGGGSDANGTTGGDYYNLGRYAIDVLSR